MGIYCYSVRTKSINLTIAGESRPAYALAFLGNSSPEWNGLEHHTLQLGIERANRVWERRSETPRFVYEATSDGDKPRECARVFEWDGRICDYDTPRFEGAKRTIGYLRSRKQGRKTVWSVESGYITVQLGSYQGAKLGGTRCFHIKESHHFWTAAEALHFANAHLIEGEIAKFQVAGTITESAMERIATPTANQIAEAGDALLARSVRMDQLGEVGEYLAARGLVCLYRCPEGCLWAQLSQRGLIELTGIKRPAGLYIELEHDRVVFWGGHYGKHSLGRGPYTSLARVKSHWEGYCETNNAKAS